MSNIYQIQQNLLSIFNAIEENEGELTPELEEQLVITKDSFKDKIESYTNVIKSLNDDITSIKAEINRLKDLQKSKEKTIERLKKIIIEAITLFGDTSKTGGKFVDYGTGKVSIRTSQVVEVDDDATNKFLNRYIQGLVYFNMQNQLHQNLCSSDELLEYANSKTTQELEEETDRPIFTLSDLEQLSADINLNVPITELLKSEHGFNLAKALIDYNDFEIKPKVNKTDIKREAKENKVMPVFAKLVDNQTITIK